MKNTLKNHTSKSSDTTGCGEPKKLEATERIKAYNKALADWNKRQLLDINSIPFDELGADLIIPISTTEKCNKPIAIRIFNSVESINIGLFIIPNQFDKTNIQDQFIADFESVRDQFDCLLFMSMDSSFIDLGFKEISANNDIKTITHYRNLLIDFESFKEVFKSKSLVIMKTAVASGINRAMEAVQDAFIFPDFYVNQVLEMKNTIACVATGSIEFTEDKVNEIGLYCLNQNKRGASLSLSTMEDSSLLNDVRVTILISGFDITV